MHNNKKYLIIIAGPTAVGKSHISIQLARDLSCEILSADSRQIYRKLDIGTAKVSQAERQLVPHHFIDILEVDERYTASQFEKEGLLLLDKIYRVQDIAILSGGTGLYLRALMEGLDEIPDVPIEIRDYFDKIYSQRGIETLRQELKLRDPEHYQRVDLQNARRLIRALSVIEHTGKSISSYHHSTPKERPFEIIPLLITRPRQQLYERINARVDLMIKSGLEDEARHFKSKAHLSALQTVGYQEWFPYFNGVYDRMEAIRLIKRNSRRYAKRQITWFNKYGNWQAITPDHDIKSHMDRLLQ